MQALNSWLVAYQLWILVAVCMAALLRGAGPERLCCLVLVGIFGVDELYHFFLAEPAMYQTIDIGHAAIDIAAAVAFVFIALRANRLYPLCLAALQILSVVSHPVKTMEDQIGPIAYGILATGPFSLEILTLTLGIAFHIRRTRQYGRYRSWRSSSAHLQLKRQAK